MPNSTGFQSIVGIDIAKSVFQVYSCDTDTGVITNEKIKRDKLLERFTNVPPCLIGMEACGSSQYWARKLIALGHTVKLMDAKLVKPYVAHNKSDKADAEGIYHALMNGTRCVPVKNATERDIDALLTMRKRLVKLQTGDINHVRGLLAEYGQIMPCSRKKFLEKVDKCINSLEGDAVQPIIDEMRTAVSGIRDREMRISKISSTIGDLAQKTKRGPSLDRARRWHHHDGVYVRAFSRSDGLFIGTAICRFPRSRAHAHRQRRQDHNDAYPEALQSAASGAADRMRSRRSQGQIQDTMGEGYSRKEAREGGACRHRQPHR